MRFILPRLSRCCWLVAVITQLLLCSVSAVTVGFQYDHYTVIPGSTVTLVTSFSEPVPGGLQGYALKMNFNPGAVLISGEDILVTPDLDFGLFDPGAQKVAGDGFASIAGFVEIGQPAYHGTDLAVFRISIPLDAQPGYYTISLQPLLAGADNFVDGNLNPLDDTLEFGITLLEIRESRPQESFDDLKLEIVDQNVRLTFTALAGWPYTIQASTGSFTGWQTIGHVIPQFNGPFEFIDSGNDIQTALFYRIVPGIH